MPWWRPPTRPHRPPPRTSPWPPPSRRPRRPSRPRPSPRRSTTPASTWAPPPIPPRAWLEAPKDDHPGNASRAGDAHLAMMTDPNARFSPDATQALNSTNFLNTFDPSQQGAQVVGAEPVPEPATILIWGLAAIAFAV